MLNTLFDSNALPNWAATGNKQYIDPRTSQYFGAQDVGSGSGTLGYGTGEGFYSGLGADLFDEFGSGIDVSRRINQDRLASFLGDNRLVEIQGGNNQFARYMEDPTGKVVGPVDISGYEDKNFGIAAALAALVTGANMGAFSGLMAGAAPTSGATTPALLESAIGTPGYGASSAGLGGGPGVLANLTAPSAVDYSLATAPNALGGGALGGTSNGVLGGAGQGMTAGIGEGLTLAAPTGTGMGITGTGTAANIIGSGIGDSLPGVGQSLLPISQQTLPGMPNGTSSPSVPRAPGVPATTPTDAPGQGGQNGGVNLGSVLGNLLGMYTANQDRQDYNDLLAKMEGLYTPDSAYSKQMQDELERRDSAAGRGSQYGPRSVELAAKLTDSKSRALSNMTMPLSASMMSRNLVASNLNNLFTGGGNPNVSNIFDAGSQVVDWGKGAIDWLGTQFPDLFGTQGG